MKIKIDILFFILLSLVCYTPKNTHVTQLYNQPKIEIVDMIENKDETNIESSGRSSRSKSTCKETDNVTNIPESIVFNKEITSKRFKLGYIYSFSTPYLVGMDKHRDMQELSISEYRNKYAFYNELKYKNVKIHGVDVDSVTNTNDCTVYETAYTNLSIENNGGYLTIDIPNDHMPLYLAPDNTSVSITGTVYHPRYNHLHTDFRINFYKTVTDSVYEE